MISLKSVRRAVVGSLVTILILTVLEFPPPIGFETRPQADVSPFWLAFFILILGVEVATILLIYKRPRFGALLGISASVLNVIQVMADQLHLMQPEVAPLDYSLLEGTVVVASVVLAYFSRSVLSNLRMIRSVPPTGSKGKEEIQA